jgi:hypothetical protein
LAACAAASAFPAANSVATSAAAASAAASASTTCCAVAIASITAHSSAAFKLTLLNLAERAFRGRRWAAILGRANTGCLR